jgi:NitT/TauT family transport system substrate-binding protein
MRHMLTTRRLQTILCATVGALLIGIAPAFAQKYGKQGDPVKLTIGYQPYYTQSWSGVVINGLELWKKHLPKGSEVEFQVGLQGAVIVGQMLADKQQIGYMGDMPSLVATNRPEVADVRLVAVLGLSEQQCNIFLVRNDAPKFNSGKDVVKWMNDKIVSSPHGSCTDRFARAVFQKEGVKPAQYLNQNIEVITTNFKAGKLDAAVIWEPTASKIVAEGIARREASGLDFGEGDAGFLAMRHDLMTGRPDVIRAWLEAELDAQLYLADPKNAPKIAEMAEKQTTGMERKVLWQSLYGAFDRAPVGSVKNEMPFVFNDKAKTLAANAHAFLHEIKRVSSKDVRQGAIDDSVAREVLQKRGLSGPVGVIKALPATEFKQ